MKYAVIKTGGKQYKVEEGQVIQVEKLEVDGQSYVFEEVLLVVDGDSVELGAPTIAGMKVYAEVVAQVKGEKLEIFKYKSKSRYRKHTGHRQKYTQLKINGIGKPGATASPLKTTKAKPAKAVKKTKEAVKPVKAPAKKAAPKKPTSPKGRTVAKK